jgi:hypothetical protein
MNLSRFAVDHPALHQPFTVASRHWFRVVHFAVQDDHVHLLVEADDNVALARGMIGLTVRLARAFRAPGLTLVTALSRSCASDAPRDEKLSRVRAHESQEARAALGRRRSGGPVLVGAVVHRVATPAGVRPTDDVRCPRALRASASNHPVGSN